ncbi:MAG: FHA domain-containing protein, partial [Desulfosalsimonas sp.]
DSSGRICIGRAEKNEIPINDTAVSTLHAEIEAEGKHFFLTDFNSRNGTFVNRELVISRRLAHGDVISVGNHTLVFVYDKDEKKPAPSEPADYQATMQLDTHEHRARLAKSVAEFTEPEEKKAQAAVITFLSKQTASKRLEKAETWIGKDPGADLRVRGWRVDKTEAKIEKRPDGYYLCPVSRKPRIRVNYESISSAVQLREFDVIEVGASMLQFHY